AVIGQPRQRPLHERGPNDLPMPIIDMYYLWSMERVAVLYNLPTIDGKEWYPWGAEILLNNQRSDGSWNGGGSPGSAPTVDSCFALLFLSQANLAKDLSSKLQLQ